MKVLVCGSREWEDGRLVLQRLSGLHPGTTVIHGDCRGADRIAARAAKMLNFEVIAVPADWSIGKSAGPIRNRKMLDMKPELVIAFHDDIENSKGTRDCVGEARRRGIPVEVIRRESIGGEA
jgi:hypothetical protein